MSALARKLRGNLILCVIEITIIEDFINIVIVLSVPVLEQEYIYFNPLAARSGQHCSILCRPKVNTDGLGSV